MWMWLGIAKKSMVITKSWENEPSSNSSICPELAMFVPSIDFGEQNERLLPSSLCYGSLIRSRPKMTTDQRWCWWLAYFYRVTKTHNMRNDLNLFTALRRPGYGAEICFLLKFVSAFWFLFIHRPCILGSQVLIFGRRLNSEFLPTFMVLFLTQSIWTNISCHTILVSKSRALKFSPDLKYFILYVCFPVARPSLQEKLPNLGLKNSGLFQCIWLSDRNHELFPSPTCHRKHPPRPRISASPKPAHFHFFRARPNPPHLLHKPKWYRPAASHHCLRHLYHPNNFLDRYIFTHR